MSFKFWEKRVRTCDLTTPFEGDDPSVWEEYPRPQMRRESYHSLCGDWELFMKSEQGERPIGTIRVPFPPESRLSGINRQVGEQYWYRKTFALPHGFQRGRVLLHFGAVDQIAQVWVNGRGVGGHVGGYLPFSFDITQFLAGGENTLEVEVTDTLDRELPYGKQRRDRGGMWYTPVSGIWQPVWLESVPETYIQSLRLTPTTREITVETVGGRPEKTVTLHLDSGDRLYRYRGDRITIQVEDPVLWTPERPHLYEFTLSDGEDVIRSYFALRTLTIQPVNGQAYICLNGRPIFLHGLLDQGYFSDGIYLPAAPAGYRYDILTAKRLGYNVLRKHAKLEPDLFYYYCDKYGMIVFQDMVNSGRYHYLIDTVFPTLGMRRGVTHHASERRRAQFENDARETVSLLYNHPCVCCYTIFNEGWGQYDADRIYGEMKALDPSRIWDATSGWFTEGESDVTSEHIYFRRVELKAQPSRPLVLSEFGGYSCKVPGHSFNLDKTYGYKKFEETAAFEEVLEGLYRKEIIPAIGKGLCAAILTQLSDVEDETNGLVTYDRQVVKVDEGTMTALARELAQAFARRTGGAREKS